LTTFRILLPLSREEPAANAEAKQAEGNAAEAPKRILVVDDEEVLRDVLTEILQSLGHEVTTCVNGAEALELYAKSWKETDLVILDMVMPVMNGHDVFIAMRRINPEIKALLSTGYTMNEEAQQILDEGVAGFIKKPFRIDELVGAVKKMLPQ
jgi:CheY-like chemotaxis protein